MAVALAAILDPDYALLPNAMIYTTAMSHTNIHCTHKLHSTMLFIKVNVISIVAEFFVL